MIDLREILSKIQQEAFAIIQEEVPVEFDNSQQTPLGFRWRGNHYKVLKPLLVSKGVGGHLHYLLLTSGGVFCLSLVRDSEGSPFCRSRWVLRYRVKIDDSAGGSGKGASLPDCAGQAAFSLPRGASKLVVPLPGALRKNPLMLAGFWGGLENTLRGTGGRMVPRRHAGALALAFKATAS